MRILFSMTNLDLGGAQMFVMRLAEELSEQGHEVYVYNHMPEWSNKDFLSSFSKKIKIISYLDANSAFITWKISAFISKFKSGFVFRHWLNEKFYRKTLKQFKFDIINSQMFDADRLNAKIALPLGVPFVITNHGEYELNFSNNPESFKREAKHCLASAQAVIYTAQKNIDAIAPLLTKDKPLYKIIIGFNGDTVARFPVNPSSLGIQKGDFIIGMVARGIPEKGWEEAIETFKLLKKKIPGRKIHLLLIGNGKELKALVEQKKEEGIHLLQFTSNTLEYFSWVEYFNAGMLMSYFKGESVPNAIIEYLYFSVPVVTTAMGDIKEMLSSPNGMAGEIIPFSNGKADPVFAADTLKRWIEDPAAYNAVKGNTAKAFEKFEMKKIASQYLNVFQEVITRFRK